MSVEARPAFYALAPGGWRDVWTILHPPYTLWHLGYVVIGAALAPDLRVGRLAATLVAFFLAMGVGAHALDEIHGRPLGTRLGRRALAAAAAASILGACVIGIVVAVHVDFLLLAFVAFGAFIVVAYNLELFGGRFHTDVWFALAWGAFPVLTGYFVTAERIGLEALLAATFATLLSLAQRLLSTDVRRVRRHVAAVEGTLTRHDGAIEPVTRETLTRGPERALQAMAGATVALAIALVLLRVT